MSSSYDFLTKIGAISREKRDILIAVVGDQWYLSHIIKMFKEDYDVKDSHEVVLCTVRIVTELVEEGFCRLARWGNESHIDEISLTREELQRIVERKLKVDPFPNDMFLVSTPKGQDWVDRYEKMLDEF